jgi:polar amino acid transport system permease protein
MSTFGWPEFLFLVRSVGWTLVLTAIAFGIGAVAGGALAIVRLAQNQVLRAIASTYILVIQSIPVLMILLLSYYGLTLIGIRVPPLVAASASLAIYVSAYLAEIWRGSIQAVPVQRSLGFAGAKPVAAIPLCYPAPGHADLLAANGRLSGTAGQEHLHRIGGRLH